GQPLPARQSRGDAAVGSSLHRRGRQRVLPRQRRRSCLAETAVTTLRRFLVLAALIFWQGGFTFYAGVGVLVGPATLGADQSIVTRRVTIFLNLAGAVALLLFAWDVKATTTRRAWRWTAWGGMALALPLLLWLHGRIDAAIDPTTASVHDYEAFYPSHR